MIWWLGLVLSLVPFTFGLVFIWRFRVDASGEIELLGVTISGPVGFLVFALGLLAGGYCVVQIADGQEPSDERGVLTGKVERVANVSPLTSTTLTRAQLKAWLREFNHARVRVNVGRGHDVRRGDYLALLGNDAPNPSPTQLAGIDSDTTALLRVADPIPPSRVTATVDGGVAVGEVLAGVPESVDAGEAMRAAPIRSGQRAAVIDYAERVDRDAVRRQIEFAGATTGCRRDLHLQEIVRQTDEFLVHHPGGFFTAEVLIAKGDALRKLGNDGEALDAYQLLLDEFSSSPRAAVARDAKNTILRNRSSFTTAQPVALTGQPSPTLVLAAYDVRTAADLGRARQARAIVPAHAITVRASKTLRAQGRVDYDAANTLDGSPRTAWGASNNGKGVSITYKFDDAYAVTTMRLVNGYAKSSSTFSANARLKTVRVTTAKGTRTVRLKDTSRRQSIPIPAGATRSVRLTIVGVYPGRALRNAMLSEAEFFTAG
jgi:hypothetical protein